MKRILILLSAAMFLLVAVCPAQNVVGAVKTKVPFDFFVGNTRFAAGEYTFQCTDNPEKLTIIGANTQKSFIINDLPKVEAATESKVIFRRDGDRRVLHQVWVQGEQHGHDLIHDATVAELGK